MPSGAAATELFVGLRDVDAKVRETKQVLRGVHGLPEDFIEDMGADQAFEAQSRRVRLEALASYIKSAVKFIEFGDREASENGFAGSGCIETYDSHADAQERN